MMLEEANARLQNCKIPNEDILWKLTPLYILLDLEKDDFCAIVDTVGIDKLINKSQLYETTLAALDERRQRDQYNANKRRLDEVQREANTLARSVIEYESKRRAELE